MLGSGPPFFVGFGLVPVAPVGAAVRIEQARRSTDCSGARMADWRRASATDRRVLWFVVFFAACLSELGAKNWLVRASYGPPDRNRTRPENGPARRAATILRQTLPAW